MRPAALKSIEDTFSKASMLIVTYCLQ